MLRGGCCEQESEDSNKLGVRVTKAREAAARESGLRPSTAKQRAPKSGAGKQKQKKPPSRCDLCAPVCPLLTPVMASCS